MSIEDLLNVEVVSTASKFPQEVREAPSSITVITAADIQRYGHRTIGDVLKSVRGFYTSYDRNYSYIGVRGFSRPGDYNTRVLLLLDGHRLNDAVYDMAPIGTEYPIDVSLIERVEVIRGPASSLYGTNAFFAVINIVTRTGAQHSGFRADAYGGSLRTRGVTASYGRLFQTDREFLLAGTHHRSAGAERLYFPELDTGVPGSGRVENLDRDKATSLFGSVSLGHVSFRGGASDRTKQVPTGSWGTVFGDDRFTTTDRRAYLSAGYDGPLGRGWSATGRLAYDYYYYEGVYPSDYGEPEPVLWLDAADSHMVTGEVTARRRFARSHLLTIGSEVRRQFRNRMWATDDYGLQVDVRRPGTFMGIYAQDEVRVFPWMIVNAGVRVDRYPSFASRATPRAGVVLLPRTQTAVKILHGRAFRAPNAYELYYFAPMREQGFTLQPEQLKSTELVWEEYISKRVRTAVTAFTYTADAIIEQRTIETESIEDVYFANATTVKGSGVEAEAEAKLPRGLNGYANYAYVHAREVRAASRLSNSPRHLMKIGVQIPVSTFYVSVEGQYIGERMTLEGGLLKGVFVPNVTITSPKRRRLELTVGVYNLSDTYYADPGGEEHVQQSIPQDGRTLLARLRVRF